MSVLDKQLEFSDGQSVSGLAAAITVATNIVPTPAGKDYWANSKSYELGGLTWNVDVNTILVGAGASVRADLVTKASAASLSSGATVIASVTIPAVSVAGVRKAVQLTPGTQALAYTGVLYTVVGATLTSAKFDSYLNFDNEIHD